MQLTWVDVCESGTFSLAGSFSSGDENAAPHSHASHTPYRWQPFTKRDLVSTLINNKVSFIMEFKRIKSFINRTLNPTTDLNWLGTLSMIFSIWFLFIPIPYKFLFTAVLSFPILGLILNWIINKKRLSYSHRPSIYTLVNIIGRNDGDNLYQLKDYITMPSCILLVRALLDFSYNINFDDFGIFILNGLIVFFIITVLISVSYRIVFYIPNKRKRVYLEFLIIFLMYSFGLTLGLNCVYDKSKPIISPSIVTDLYTRRSNKIFYYNVKLTKVENKNEKIDLKISRHDYLPLNIGDTISLVEKEGLLNITWYEVKY